MKRMDRNRMEWCGGRRGLAGGVAGFGQALLAFMLVAFTPAGAQAAGRVALVVGNSAYEQTSLLANPVNDAEAVGAALERIGFDVTVLRNADEDAMDDALGELAEASTGADVSLLFYAGHGMEMNGANYLIPVDARLASASAVPLETIPLDSVLGAMANARTRIVILDACRNNPFARSMRGATRANVRSGGLAAVASGEGLLVAYAAAAGDVAADGDGSENSPYTTALLEHLERPGVDVRIMLGDVGAAVMARTGDQQPFISASLSGEHHLNPLVGEHYLSGSGGGGVTDGPPDPVRAQQETVFWQSAANSTDAADFEAYLERWPNGVYASLARNRLAALRAPTPNPSRPDPSATARPDPDPVRTHADSDVFRDCPSCPELVAIPAGTFRMGSGPDDDEALDRERPRHRVRVGRFALGRYEVTRREYRAFAEATGADDSWRDPGFAQSDSHPVVNVSWRDAQAYVQWLSRETGERYRLPSEAEWEYAARGGTTTRRYWGDSSSSQCGYANGTVVSCDDGAVRTAPVGSYAPNEFGLSDVLGNVWEWTDDCWHENYAGAADDGRAWTRGGDCGRRVLRGGSWYNLPRSLRSAARPWNIAGTRDAFTGFRVARTLDQ